MRIVVLTDVHGNLPALGAALAVIRDEGYDAIVHTGDAIGIGPFPAECLDTLRHVPHIQLLMGNHDAWFAHGLPQPLPPHMGPEFVEHVRWTHAQIDPALRADVAGWPYRIALDADGVPLSFLHYALDDTGHDFAPIVRDATPEDLDRLFADEAAAGVFYGHHHPFSDLQGRARYVNPGALGAYDRPLARWAVVEAQDGAFTVEFRAAEYDDRPLRQAFESRRVPARAFLYRAFLGGRFSEGA